ncbi:MAG TPA: hypothetical protein VK828_08215 [Terriglobales bacterium]|jgi:hypothetical protein|nr:hypothetical protein [Terriglobales bacterium]
MTNASRATMFRFLAVALLVLAATAWAQNRPPILEKIAKTYGLDSYGQVEAIRYTWNGEITGLFKAAHVWEWEPKTGKVSFEGTDKDGKPVKVTYMRSDLSSQPDNVKNQVEPAFVNDNYWLLFPLHAYWDTSATVTDEGMQKVPSGKGTAEKVVVKYAPELGGYTPGDTWELYVGKDDRVEYLVFRHGGDKKPSVVKATWVAYKKAGPLDISTDHRGDADGKPLHIFISNLAVKVTGSDKWIEAK